MKCLASIALLTLILSWAPGCAVAPSPSTHRLLMHRAVIDLAGLRPVRAMPAVKSSLSTPEGWNRLVPTKSSLYTVEQWRSPSEQTGVGVAYIRMPLPLSASAICWFAKQEYSKQAKPGSGSGSISTWTDALGRAWFEGENKKYHVRGYAVVRGLDAWVVYCGYRLPGTPDPSEMALALKSVETIVPLTDQQTHAHPTTAPSQPQFQNLAGK